MPLRLIESIVPTDSLPVFEVIPEGTQVIDRWDEMLNDDKALVRMLVEAGDVEQLMDSLVERSAGVEGFRVMLLPVEATLPRPSEPEPVEINAEHADTQTPERINREEIYNSVAEGASLSRVFVAQVILATLVAAVGLMRGDTAILIGAMVIAPLLGPNVALCLATTLGDWKLLRRSLKTNLAGVAIALAAAFIIGSIFPVSMAHESVAARTQVSPGDIILALASGCAGVLAFTSGAPSALIGVMVAVALLPPTATLGMLLAGGEMSGAVGALMLVATNVICVNLAGTLTFLVQGLKPQSWWAAERARRVSWMAMALWIGLLIVLVLLMYSARGSQFNENNESNATQTCLDHENRVSVPRLPGERACA